MTTLDELARIHDSDKWKHGYTVWCDELFTPIRDDNIKLLEIGIWKGASLSMWTDYFPNARIIGMDIAELKFDPPHPRITTLQGDQTDRARLIEIAEKHGPFDIIIDDGGHRMHQQQTSLGVLFRYLKPLGFYIIEDLHTSFRPTFNPTNQITTFALAQKYRRKHTIKSPSFSEEDQQDFPDMIQSVTIFRKHRSRLCSFRRVKEEKRPAKTLIKLIEEQIGEPTNGAEIGVWLGHTSLRLLWQFPDLRLRLVDCWHKGTTHETMPKSTRRLRVAWKQVVAQTAEFGDRSSILRMPSNRAAWRVKDGSLDFVFIDAEHTYESVKWDLELWCPKVRPGGLIAGHDYMAEKELPWHREVKRAVDEFVEANGYNGVELAPADIWWFKKKGEER